MTAATREASGGGTTRLSRRPELALVALFLTSRCLLHRSGVSMQSLHLEGSWQLIDPELLRQALLESLVYLHSQPPLYNLLIGSLLKLEPDPAAAAALLDGLYAALGLTLVLLLHHLMRRLGVGPKLSFTAAALFTLSPAALLYENYAFYTLPCAVVLCLTVVLFERTVSAFTPWRAFSFFGAMTLLIYLRSLFQIEWFLVLALLCIWLLPGHRTAAVAAAALPLVLVVGLYAKNAAITGQFATSSWLGMSVAKLTTMQLPPAERVALVEAGKLSPVALRPPFSPPSDYPALLAATPVTGIPVLDRVTESTGGVNFNHASYASISRQYLEDALAVVREQPRVYLASMGRSYLMYFRPSADYPFLEPNRTRIAPLVRVYNFAIAGQPRYTRAPQFELRGHGEIGYLIIAGLALCVVSGGAAAARCIRGRRKPADAAIVFIWLNVLYVTLLGNALEIDENQRFRFLINPLLVVVLAVIAARWIRTREGRR